ncbi:helix-turn-helix transcriptional regulator [Aquabacterium sp. OR-4]|uniref:helix-turn-helix transcriptional regulator n=1 Tax=Aquabacterium sp. OR-4 TaxID=2978127 RepID=UPI0021B27323|nr:LuxR C-terminal-related transcriptional regulator [Aquabacterium sp. OR-4]MDT7833641.1 LuxR C-terminal-related transcriptional regulator [Aquabacterium sp. OR-4]
MLTWPLAPTAAATALDRPEQACLGTLIGQLGEPGFAHGALEGLNHALRAGSWSVYRLRTGQPPVLHCSAARGVPDTTRDCFAAYLDGLYRRDASFDAVRRQRGAAAPLVLKMAADEAPSRAHREAIYQRHGVLERLSVAALEDDGSLLAVNLYRHERQGVFEPVEQERFARLAPLLLAGVRQHLRLQARLVDPAPGHALAADAAAAAARARLQARCPALTVRELDVCERLLRGWSYDGIAADLGLTVATVKTYRARAFGRLGLHFRSELFAWASGQRH